VGSEVLVTLAREGRACVLAVHNEGEPVSHEDLPHLFERFYRSDKARTRADGSAVGGYGLGLAIARNIAELHGGSISVTSDLSGTVFLVTLPLKLEQEQEKGANADD
jgi:signal transduction histidine kinase